MYKVSHETSVEDPKVLFSDPDTTCRAIPDLAPTCQVITDPDPTFQDVSDPDPTCKFFLQFSQDFLSRSKCTK